MGNRQEAYNAELVVIMRGLVATTRGLAAIMRELIAIMRGLIAIIRGLHYLVSLRSYTRAEGASPLPTRRQL